MSEVDFWKNEQAKAWFEKQTDEVRRTMASRAALRVLANYRPITGGALDDHDLSLFRAILISAGRGAGRPADTGFDWDAAYSAARSAADSAAFSADSVDASAARSAAFTAANSVAFSADDSAARSANSAADSAAFSAARSAAFFAAHSATAWDSRHLDVLLDRPVWAGAEVPEAIAKNHETLKTLLSADPAWTFWKRFYEGMWEGTFTEWDLALKVIQIPQEDWQHEDGYQHIAKVIAELAAELKEQKPQNEGADYSAYRPSNVTQLFDNAPQVRASFELSASTLTERFDLFYQMACPNDVIPLFEPLRAMPEALTRAADLLGTGARDEATENALKDEIAKLRALLATVETELKAAKAEIEELKKKPWYKSAKVVAGGSVVGAILGTAWMVSGDELGPQKRFEMLTDYWEFVFPRDELEEEFLQYALPRTLET